jgi:Domain of unknown function (DUF4276)
MTVRVTVLCEGQTEEQFTKRLLVPFLAERGVYLYARLVEGQGGDVRWPRLRRDILHSLKSDAGAHCTTFIDYDGRATRFPGEDLASRTPHVVDRKRHLEQGMTTEIASEVGERNARRFIPYIQMYEFEGLLFSAPERLASILQLDGHGDLAAELQAIRDLHGSPEEINDHRTTAPSKRIAALCPSYRKPMHGVLTAEYISLAVIRAQCSLFDAWVTRLEALGTQEAA